MQKHNIVAIFSCILLCGTFAQAQSANDFNDVRPLGVLLNPAHIGKADAKGELGMNYQYSGNDNYISALDPKVASQEIAATYTHYIRTKSGVLSLGLLAGTRQNGDNDYTSGGVSAAYAFRLGVHDLLSGGASVNILNNKLTENELWYRIGGFWECYDPYYNNYRMVTSNVFATINTGLAWQHNFDENANIKLGLIANNINTPMMTFEYENENGAQKREIFTIMSYMATLSSEFMTSRKVGFEPMFFYKRTNIGFYEPAMHTMFYGTDIIFKNKKNNQWRVGYFLRNRYNEYSYNGYQPTDMMAVAYKTQKLKVGVSTTLFALAYRGVQLGQINFQYAF